jgi:ATP-dependent Clp protease ATP-binding subunit ClpX
LKLYQALFELDGIRMKFTNSSVEAIARKAIELKVGARGLRMVLERIMLDAFYNLPSQRKIKKFILTSELVESGTLSLQALEQVG